MNPDVKSYNHMYTVLSKIVQRRARSDLHDYTVSDGERSRLNLVSSSTGSWTVVRVLLNRLDF